MTDDIRIETNDPEAVRAEIDRTRARMSGTLDEIEGVLATSKARIRQQLDIGARVREKPLQAAGIVLGGGLILGFLTGSGSREDGAATRAAIRRGADWERRARRLLEIARTQEEEVERLRAATASTRSYRPGRQRYRLGPEDPFVDDDDPYGVDDIAPGAGDLYDPDDGWAEDPLEWDDNEGLDGGESRLALLKESLSDFVSDAAREILAGIRSRR